MSQKPCILFVDDEERIVRSLRMLFREHYEVLTTTDPEHAIQIVSGKRVYAIVSDQRMPQMLGAELLRRIRAISPNTMRILLTGYSELDAVIASVNEGEIFRFINKPWDTNELKATVAQAVEIAHSLFGADGAYSRVQPSAQSLELLVMDEDPMIADVVREAAQSELGYAPLIHWCDTLEDAFYTLSRHEIGIVLSEIRLSGENISGALKTLKQHHPDILTIILTSFKDTTVLVDLINQGQVFRFLPKPVSRNLLGRSISTAYSYRQTLLAAPDRLRCHAVDPIRSSGDQAIAARIRNLVDRIRGRERTGIQRA